MKLNDMEKNLLYPVVHARVEQLKGVIKAWDDLPDDATVNALERFAAARAKEDLPKYEALLKRIKDGDPAPVIEPVTDLDEDDVTYTKQMLGHLNEAKYYADQAGDRLLLLKGDVGFEIGDRISAVHSELEQLESLVIEAYPQVLDEEDETE